MSLQTTVPAFRNSFLLPGFESLKFLASLLMQASADNRMLMQIENSKQNVGCCCTWREAVLIMLCYVSFVYFWISVFQLGQLEVEIAVSGSPEGECRFLLLGFCF